MAIDGSAAGRNCVTLMVALVYRQRALPIAWTVIEGKKGHFPEEMHVELVRQVQKIVPQGARVVVLGDGEFDGINLQAVINQWRWGYVVRTAKTAVLNWEDHQFSFDDVAGHVIEGDRFEIPGALFTRKNTALSRVSHVGARVVRSRSISSPISNRWKTLAGITQNASK